jgi:uncharacterized membrane protein
MKVLFAILLLVAAGHAQSFVISAASPPEAPSRHRFWTVETKVSAGIFAGLVAADATLTQRGLNDGMRETNPIMRPFVTRGAAGSAAGSALGYGTGLGVVYLLHRTNHHKAERLAMRLMVGMEGAVVARNLVVIR